jgi:hypothetical protein
MSAQPAYAHPMEHPPRFLTHGLPPNGVLTAADLAALPADPFWTYDLPDGMLLVRSRDHTLPGDRRCCSTSE